MAEWEPSHVPLLAHPDFPGEGVRRVLACAAPAGPDSLRLQYVLEADLRRLRIPQAMAGAGRADELWAHTCFEAFIGTARAPGYLELNFSPSGQWAAYRFDSYRRGMTAAADVAPRLALRRTGKELELQAEVPASVIASCEEPRLRIALSAVVEDLEGRLSYWALRHPPGRPDFHHPESLSLVLEPASHSDDSP